ncbi:MAG: hypothetical protein JWM10_2003 [Myxococcaceae bacterium]|nr:hypothetical protein [Myxococcaceae bacterium]
MATYSWRLVAAAVAARLAAACSAPVEAYDASTSDTGRLICFPSCRLGEVCTAANRCEAMTNPFRDAGAASDRGRD